MKVGFGKFADREMERVPTWYLKWLSTDARTQAIREEAARVLAARQTAFQKPAGATRGVQTPTKAVSTRPAPESARRRPIVVDPREHEAIRGARGQLATILQEADERREAGEADLF